MKILFIVFIALLSSVSITYPNKQVGSLQGDFSLRTHLAPKTGVNQEKASSEDNTKVIIGIKFEEIDNLPAEEQAETIMAQMELVLAETAMSDTGEFREAVLRVLSLLNDAITQEDAEKGEQVKKFINGPDYPVKFIRRRELMRSLVNVIVRYAYDKVRVLKPSPEEMEMALLREEMALLRELAGYRVAAGRPDLGPGGAFGRFSAVGSEGLANLPVIEQADRANQYLSNAVKNKDEFDAIFAVNFLFALLEKTPAAEHYIEPAVIKLLPTGAVDILEPEQKAILKRIAAREAAGGVDMGGAFGRFSPAGMEFIIQGPVVDSAL